MRPVRFVHLDESVLGRMALYVKGLSEEVPDILVLYHRLQRDIMSCLDGEGRI